MKSFDIIWERIVMEEQTYELVLIMAPEKEAQEVANALVEKVLKRVKANVLHRDEWGEKVMAYEIAGNKSGFYVTYMISLKSAQAEELKKRFQTEKGLLRWALFKHDEEK